MEVRPVGAVLYHEYGQTDGRTGSRDEANNRFSQFRNFANAPKISYLRFASSSTKERERERGLHIRK